jgi:hypothetical protein
MQDLCGTKRHVPVYPGVLKVHPVIAMDCGQNAFVSQVRRLVADFLPRRPRFDPRSSDAGFMWKEVAL